MTTVSIILVNYNGYEQTRKALGSIATHAPTCQVILVDNHSDENDVQRLRQEFPVVVFVQAGRNLGFGGANNLGTGKATGQYLLFLNNDTILSSDVPSKLGTLLDERQDVAATGPRLLNTDGSLQMSFGYDPTILSEWKIKKLQRLSKENPAMFSKRMEPLLEHGTTVDWLTGAALMVRKTVFEEVNGFDDSFFMYFEDADLCRRIRERGWKVVYDQSCSLVHVGGASTSPAARPMIVEYRKSQLRYYSKHSSLIAQLLVRLYLLVTFGMRSILAFVRNNGELGSSAEVFKSALKPIR
jgi:hypothetical protein